MPFHSASDLETIFDADMGSGYTALVSPPAAPDYTVTALRFMDVAKADEFGNMHESVTMLHFLRSAIPGQLVRGTEVTLDGRTYTIETLADRTTYMDIYEVS